MSHLCCSVLDASQELWSSKNTPSVSLHPFQQDSGHSLTLNCLGGSIDIIVLDDDPIVWVNIIRRWLPVFEAQHSSMVASVKHDDLSFVCELPRSGQSMEIGFSAGVGEAHSFKSKALAHFPSKQLLLRCRCANIHAHGLEDIAHGIENHRVRVAIERCREFACKICVAAET